MNKQSHSSAPLKTRRYIIAAAGGVLASAAAPIAAAAAAPLAAGRMTVADLIVAHRTALALRTAAKQVFDDVLGRLKVLEAASPILVPLTTSPDGKGAGPRSLCIRQIGATIIAAEVKAAHDALRAAHLSPWARASMSPEQIRAAESAIDASEQRSLAGIESAQQEKRRRRATSGLDAAEESYDTARRGEIRARAMLIVALPTTKAEAREKQRYMADELGGALATFVSEGDDDDACDFDDQLIEACCAVRA